MHRTIVLITALGLSGSAFAEASCAMQVATLLAAHQSASLAALFSRPAANLVDQLVAIESHVGKITELSDAAGPFSGATVRRSIVSTALPSTYSSLGTWASAKSERLGAIRIQASAEPGKGCKLLALHVDTQAN